MESPLFLFGMKGGKSCRGGMGTPTMTRRGCRKTPRSSDRQRAERTVCELRRCFAPTGTFSRWEKFIAAITGRRGTEDERKALLPYGVRQFCCRRSPCRGLTRRLRRGRWGCRPEGDSTFFRSERKYQRKHAARRLREKALDCPFLKEGVRNVARNGVGQLSHTGGARSCSPFSAVKMGGPFSLRCLSPLCSPAVGAGPTQISGAWSISL